MAVGPAPEAVPSHAKLSVLPILLQWEVPYQKSPYVGPLAKDSQKCQAGWTGSHLAYPDGARFHQIAPHIASHQNSKGIQRLVVFARRMQQIQSCSFANDWREGMKVRDGKSDKMRKAFDTQKPYRAQSCCKTPVSGHEQGEVQSKICFPSDAPTVANAASSVFRVAAEFLSPFCPVISMSFAVAV